MFRTLRIAAASAVVLAFSPTAFAQQTDGTAAKAMLMKAVAAVKAALDMFNKGEGGFLDRDLYVFCFNGSDAKAVADGNPNAKELIGLRREDPQGLYRKTFWCRTIRRVPEAGRRIN
jgi:hypothetical protein